MYIKCDCAEQRVSEAENARTRDISSGGIESEPELVVDLAWVRLLRFGTGSILTGGGLLRFKIRTIFGKVIQLIHKLGLPIGIEIIIGVLLRESQRPGNFE